MDFFNRQDEAFARSRKFYMAFGLAIFLAVVVLYFTITGVLMVFLYSIPLGVMSLPEALYGAPPEVLSLRPFLIIGSIITVIILSISIRRMQFIRDGGGAYIAEILEARLLETPANLKENQLVNVVEEMAVAAGLPRPRLYIIPGIRSINAITAGVDYDDAIIAVTEGAVKHLDRDELQGVIAHEFAHILNGDYSLNLTMAGWLYGLLFFYIQGYRIFVSTWASAGDLAYEGDALKALPVAGCLGNFPFVITGLFLMIGGWIGKIGAQLIQAAFSRQREYLADAFAVQFTRNTEGLASAMKKIAWTPRHGFVKSSDALTMQAFFIVNPARIDGLFQTHPPLEERIKILDPAWDGEPLAIAHDDFRPPKDLSEKYSYGPGKVTFSKKINKTLQQMNDRLKDMDSWGGILIMGLLEADVEGGQAIDPGQSLKAAHELYAKIPESLRVAVDDKALAPILVASVFVNDEPELKRRQQLIIEKRLGREAAVKALGFQGQMLEAYRLTLLGAAAPTLKQMPQEEKNDLIGLVKVLVAADGKVDLFEIAACQILKKSLGDLLQPGSDASAHGVGSYAEQTKTRVLTVISLLASLDAENQEAAQASFAAAMAHFKQWPPQQIILREQITSKIIIESLNHLAKAPVKIKNSLVAASVSACIHKNRLTDSQYQLLRALAAAVDVPLPLLSAR